MQVLQAVMLVVRAVTLRSARLPQPTAVEAAAMGKGLLLRVSVDAVVASVRRVQMRPLQGLMAQEAEAVAVRLRASAL